LQQILCRPYIRGKTVAASIIFVTAKQSLLFLLLRGLCAFARDTPKFGCGFAELGLRALTPFFHPSKNRDESSFNLARGTSWQIHQDRSPVTECSTWARR
jgi:hypothetical protein